MVERATIDDKEEHKVPIEEMKRNLDKVHTQRDEVEQKLDDDHNPSLTRCGK